MDANLNNLVVLTISIEFVFFGWRINREIAVGDKEPSRPIKQGQSTTTWRTWFPLADLLNLGALVLVTLTCVAAPIITGRFNATGRAILVGAVVIWLFHPMSMACHYELFRGGRQMVYGQAEKWPRVTRSERVLFIVSTLIGIAAAVGAWFWIVFVH